MADVAASALADYPCMTTQRTTSGIAAEHVLARRILRHYSDDVAAMREAREWYGVAQGAADDLAARYGVTREAAAGVIAAMSPRQTWKGNLRAADVILHAAAHGLDLPAVGLRSNARKAWKIANGAAPLDVLGGPKVRAFFANIIGDLDAVTVDVWAARAAGVDPNHLTAARYRAVADAYRRAAASIGLAPAILQAIVWVSIRGAAA